MTSIGMKGGPELLDFLGAFPKRLQNGAVRAGLVAGAKPVRDYARVLAPKKTGMMAKAIRTGSARVNQDGTVSVRIRLKDDKKGWNNRHAFLGIFWERGTKFYSGKVIQRGGSTRRRSRKFHTNGSAKFGMFPDIAAHRAHPFMVPALEAKAGEAINAMGERIRGYLKSKASFTAPITIEADI